MARLNDDTFSSGLETAKLLLGHPRFSTALAKAIRQEGGADRAVDALVREMVQRDLMNGSLAITVDDQIKLFTEAVRQEGWDIPSDTLLRLYDSAPPWPSGPLAVRSLRIRFGKGQAGVERTYEAHITRLIRIYGKRFSRWASTKIQSSWEQISLVAGNATHQPCVEWIVADLDTGRKREGIAQVRGALALADELLVIAWMFPKLIESTRQNGDLIPGFFAGGYQIGEGIVPGIRRIRIASDETAKYNPGRDEIELIGDRIDNTSSAMSVPLLRL